MAGLVGLAGCGGEDEEAATTTTTAAPSTASTTTTVAFTGEGSEEFCAVSRDNVDLFRQGDALASDPDRLGETLREAAPAVRQAASVAPEEIRADVDVLAAAYESALASFEAGSLDLSAFISPRNAASYQKLARYWTEVCGITL